jgi:hypothetical protein
MGQSNLIAFIIENRVVIVVLLLFLLVLLTALILILIYIAAVNTHNSLDYLEREQDKQTNQIISLKNILSNLPTNDNLAIYNNQIEMLYEQKNIISYFKKEILPEQVLVFFAAKNDLKIYSIVIENQNKFYTLNNVSLSVSYTEIGRQNISENLKQLCELIESVKNISIAPEKRYTIPLNDIPYREYFKHRRCFIEVNVSATYNVDGKQKDLSVTVPCFMTYRYRADNSVYETRITYYNF